MKPTVAGSPASASIEIVSGQASSGRSRPSPRTARMSSPKARLALAGDDHAKAARFMKR